MFTINFKNSKLALKSVVKILILATIAFTIFAAYNLKNSDSYLIGKNLGLLAASAFLITITPGIIKRFELKGRLKELQILLMFSRTQLGLLMFFLALGHYILTYIKPVAAPAIAAGGQPTPELYTTLGLFTFMLAGLLAITSNTQSRKRMGKWWIYLHSAVYLMLWLIFLHVALGSRNLLVLIAFIAFGALQITSLVYARTKKTPLI